VACVRATSCRASSTSRWPSCRPVRTGQRRARNKGNLDIARYITTPKGEIAGKVLLVDDLADTGKTLAAVIDQLRNNYKPITELRSAVIWTKGVSAFKADYSVEFLPTNPWIHQPFENYDSMSPEMLLEKWKL
jgi:hypoxanthine phosphoribosyltransferase